MVTVQQPHRDDKRSPWLHRCICLVLLLLICFYLAGESSSDAVPEANKSVLRPAKQSAASIKGRFVHPEALSLACPYTLLSQLTKEERFPSKGSRHMVDPPSGGTVTLVCCNTTKGPWSIAVHSNWAPFGAQRFLDMVQSDYFNTRVPLFRCINKWLCQFGLSSDAALTKQYNHNLLDDKPWLPQGPDHRQVNGVKRFAKGYMAYAGAGPNTRSNQFIVALQPNGPLAGGSPWEVPWGEMVGEHSFETLSKIYTGYGENGPSQGLLHRNGLDRETADKFPLLDYIMSCHVVDQETQR